MANWVVKQANGKQVHVVMEATNVPCERPAHHFHRFGLRVSAVNPVQIKYFARSALRCGKTDAVDAEITAQYGGVTQPPARTPPARVRAEPKQLTPEREAVLAQRTQEDTHLMALKDAQHASPIAILRLSSVWNCSARLMKLNRR